MAVRANILALLFALGAIVSFLLIRNSYHTPLVSEEEAPHSIPAMVSKGGETIGLKDKTAKESSIKSQPSTEIHSPHPAGIAEDPASENGIDDQEVSISTIDTVHTEPAVTKSPIPVEDASENCDEVVAEPPSIPRHEAPTMTPSSRQLVRSGPPILLWWNAISGESMMSRRTYCGANSCLVTDDRSYFTHEHTAALLFYGSEFGSLPLPLPRNLDQIWALYHEESPMNNWKLIFPNVISLFNFTSTYSEGSDAPIPLQWARSMTHVLARNPVPVHKKSINGLAPVIYVQSNCHVPSDRTRYVEELMKYIKVDSYGQCLHNKEFEDRSIDGFFGFDDDAFYDLIGRYKFALSMENAICEGYMTEKLFRPLESGAVPVYRGAPNACNYVPEKSVIFVDDFKNPKDLAEFLNFLDQNDDEYLKYLEYRERDSKLIEGFRAKLEARKYRGWGYNDPYLPHTSHSFECDVCDWLHIRADGESKIADHTHLPCPFPTPSFPLRDDEVESVDPGYYARQAEANANALYRTVLQGAASPHDEQLLK